MTCTLVLVGPCPSQQATIKTPMLGGEYAGLEVWRFRKCWNVPPCTSCKRVPVHMHARLYQASSQALSNAAMCVIVPLYTKVFGSILEQSCHVCLSVQRQVGPTHHAVNDRLADIIAQSIRINHHTADGQSLEPPYVRDVRCTIKHQGSFTTLTRRVSMLASTPRAACKSSRVSDPWVM